MTATDWIENYKKAWASNEPADIRALFTVDASYAYSPNGDTSSGHDEIVASWLDGKDEPGDFTFEYWVVTENNEVAIVQGVTDYTPSGGDVYDNLWVIRWGGENLAKEFTEWYIKR